MRLESGGHTHGNLQPVPRDINSTYPDDTRSNDELSLLLSAISILISIYFHSFRGLRSRYFFGDRAYTVFFIESVGNEQRPIITMRFIQSLTL